MKSYATPRLVYCMGKIRILNLDESVETAGLPANCTLALMGLQSFAWDSARCDKNLKLENR